MATIKVTTETESSGGRLRNTILIRQRGHRERRLYFDFSDDSYVDACTSRNFALLAVLPYAMHNGLDVRCTGPVDEDLIERLEECQEAWAVLRPDLFRVVRIEPDDIAPARVPKNRKAVIAFSGGLDSAYALFAHKQGLVGRRTLDVSAAVLVHGFDVPLDRQERFDKAAEMARRVLDAYDVPLVTAVTNWHELRTPWEQSHMLALAAVLQQFSGRVSHGVFAADTVYGDDIHGWGSSAVTNPLIGGSSFPVRAAGTNKTRTEKAKAVSGEPVFLENLHVCWSRRDAIGNCGTCEKCIRTKLNFAAFGVNHVPALGAPLTVDDVRGLELGSKIIHNLFVEILDVWEGDDRLRAALAEKVAEGPIHKPPNKKLRGPPKWLHSIRKRVPRLSRAAAS